MKKVNIYLGIKFYENLKNKHIIERICNIAENEYHQIVCIHRDIEKWGKVTYKVDELMKKTFTIINNSDVVVIEFSESGVGIGIEAGYAVARNIPVYILLPKGKDLSPTMQGICKDYFEYETDDDIRHALKTIKKENTYK